MLATKGSEIDVSLSSWSLGTGHVEGISQKATKLEKYTLE
jgi:hypothetical protein